MRVIIAGSRRFPLYGITEPEDWEIPRKRAIMCSLLLDCIRESYFNITEVVCGCCWGIDEFGRDWAIYDGTPYKNMPADWDNLGKKAGSVRNKQMAEYADALICIHSGTSGSIDMIDCMKELSKPYYERKIK